MTERTITRRDKILLAVVGVILLLSMLDAPPQAPTTSHDGKGDYEMHYAEVRR